MRLLVINEGRDAGGKGGTIKRFVEHMNPRGSRVVALDKPSDRERTQWYFQRYVAHLPSAGEIVLFDRSWYNRAMVERVMGFCNGAEVKEFLRSVPELERMLIRSGISLIKFYYSVSKKEQARRFNKRTHDPLKQWKLSPVDQESQDKWEDYTEGQGGHVLLHLHGGQPLDHHQVRRQEAGPHQCHPLPAQHDRLSGQARGAPANRHAHRAHGAGRDRRRGLSLG